MTGNQSSSLSRREFLKTSVYSLAGAFLPSQGRITLNSSAVPAYGRVVRERMAVFSAPFLKAPLVQSHMLDDVFSITAAVEGDPKNGLNSTWYKLGERRYAHASDLQPVDIQLNDPVEISSGDQLAEVTLPFTDAHWKLNATSKIAYRFYYQSTHWIDALVHDPQGVAFYRVKDDLIPSRRYFVPAAHMRIIPAEELTPIAPEVPVEDKRIEVYRQEQIMICYQGSEPVRITSVSTGDDLANPEYATPPGSYKTFWKKPSRHMSSVSPAILGPYDLPGVPFVSYITLTGYAFHGVYWHNDFGRPRSHGCINLKPEEARWLFRWTQPSVAVNAYERMTQNYGTQVEIF